MHGREQERGFSLVEMVVVLAIMGILMTIVSLHFDDMRDKTRIEQDVQTIYNNLITVRLDSLYTKTPRTVTFDGKFMKTYPGSNISVAPLLTTELKYPVMVSGSSPYRVDFDAGGMMNNAEMSICIDASGSGSLAGNAAFKDSVDVGAALISMGKRRPGETCVPEKVDPK